MRSLIIVPFCLAAAACSGGGGGEEKKAEAAAATMEAGQWETNFEVLSHRSTDKTEPVIKAAVGDKASATGCITEADKAKPSADLFAGEGYTCQYKDSYIKNGRVTASLSCRHTDAKGDMMMSVEGRYTGTTFEGRVDTTTFLPGNGDFAMSRRLTARKTGATCEASPVKAA